MAISIRPSKSTSRSSEEAKRLTRLIDNILTFSRIEGTKQIFEFDEVDISGIVDTAFNTIRRR